MHKTRPEAFSNASNGVLAIRIIMVLDLRPPHGTCIGAVLIASLPVS